MSITEREPARPGEARRAPPEPPEQAQAVTLFCPCSRVGRACAACVLPPLGARPPVTHPAGWLIASIAGPVWRFRGWLWGAIHER
jgi:hypothetical protein